MEKKPRTEDLKYKEPEWLSKILSEADKKKVSKDPSFRQNLMNWLERAKRVGMKPRPGATGQAHRDRLLKQID
jgi:hypothetical protein